MNYRATFRDAKKRDNFYQKKKKETVPYYIENWRPISLFNCDYNIATKAIANRIKTVIPKIINHDQMGFIKDKFIGENIRLIDSFINFCVDKNTPGPLLLTL